MKIVTSIGLFNDAVGKRMSITYSEVDDTTGQVVSDNKRIDRVITKAHPDILADIADVEAFAQEFVDAEE